MGPAQTPPLAPHFLARAAPEVRGLLAADPTLEETLAAALADARAAWPALAVDALDFVAVLAERAAPRPSAGESLDGLRGAELYLVHGCLGREPAALAAATRLLAAEVARAGRRAGTPASLNEEVLQSLTANLLVGDRGPPGLSRFTGRGSLAGFFRAAALRTLLRQRAREARAAPLPEGDLPDAAAGLRDPELELYRARYREDFSAAFQGALAALTRHERALLRLHLAGGVGLEGLAASYRVDRSTVARWLAAARTRLLEMTQRALVERLHLAPAEVRSLTRLLHSQLDVSVARILNPSGR